MTRYSFYKVLPRCTQLRRAVNETCSGARGGSATGVAAADAAKHPLSVGPTAAIYRENKRESGPKMSLFPMLTPGERGRDAPLLAHSIGDRPRAGPKRP